MKRNNLPDFSKPLRTLDFDQKCEKLKIQNFEKIQKNPKNRHDYLLFSVEFYVLLLFFNPLTGLMLHCQTPCLTDLSTEDAGRSRKFLKRNLKRYPAMNLGRPRAI